MSDLPDRQRVVTVTTVVVAIAWIVLDQATKIAAVRALEGQPPNDLGPLVLRVIRNSGGAGSLPLELPWVFVVGAVVVSVLVARALPDTRAVSLAAVASPVSAAGEMQLQQRNGAHPSSSFSMFAGELLRANCFHTHCRCCS